MAFTIFIYEYILNPDNNSILINKQAMRDSLLENKVSTVDTV